LKPIDFSDLVRLTKAIDGRNYMSLWLPKFAIDPQQITVKTDLRCTHSRDQSEAEETMSKFMIKG